MSFWSTAKTPPDRGPLVDNRPAMADLLALANGRHGVHDVPCPVCGPDRTAPSNRIRRVLRVWIVDDAFATYFCARCEIKGQAHAEGRPMPSPRALERAHLAREDHVRASARERLRVACYLWGQRQPLAGSIAERYLRTVRGYGGPLPGTLAFLPARADHPPAMIAPFGQAEEPEPGRLAMPELALRGIHLTRLKPDGSGKTGRPEKIMIGRSTGSPIVLAPPNDNLGLAITEGIEDALSIHEATGLGAFAAGSASRMAALIDSIPSYIDCVSIIADDDKAGERGSAGLCTRLQARGIDARIVRLGAMP